MNTYMSQEMASRVVTPSASFGVLAAVARWWWSVLERRAHAKTITLLHSLSDRDLHDLGIPRAEIEPRVRSIRYY